MMTAVPQFIGPSKVEKCLQPVLASAYLDGGGWRRDGRATRAVHHRERQGGAGVGTSTTSGGQRVPAEAACHATSRHDKARHNTARHGTDTARSRHGCCCATGGALWIAGETVALDPEHVLVNHLACEVGVLAVAFVPAPPLFKHPHRVTHPGISGGRGARALNSHGRVWCPLSHWWTANVAQC